VAYQHHYLDMGENPVAHKFLSLHTWLYWVVPSASRQVPPSHTWPRTLRSLILFYFELWRNCQICWAYRSDRSGHRSDRSTKQSGRSVCYHSSFLCLASRVLKSLLQLGKSCSAASSSQASLLQ